MKNFKRIIAVLLSALMLFSLVGCGDKGSGGANDTPMVVGYSNFSEKFSPFFADTAYDQDVTSMVNVGLLPSDRTGAVLLKAKEGQVVNYNGTDYTYYGVANCDVTENADGTVTYDFDLRDDVTFSDGTKLTADDVIFSMYVLSDPTYDGSSTFWNLPVEGMKEYRSGMDIFYNLLLAAGKDNTDFTFWTQEEQDEFWNEAVPAAGAKFAQSIVDYVLANYGEAYGAVDFPSAAALWGYDNADAASMWEAILANYDTLGEAVDTEIADVTFYSLLDEKWAKGVTTGESVDYISGIVKNGDYSLTVKLTEVSAVALYQLGIIIAPLHYYGDASAFDYDAHKFGFTKGDLSSVKAVTTKPLGAGPYKFDKYEDGIVYFEANDSYFLGAPKTKYVQFKEGPDTDKMSGVTAGTTDVSDPSFNTTVAASIKAVNSNGELTGDKITTSMVDNLGYGYIGICADRVNVGGVENKGSEESKALRKAIATVLASYRDISVDSYYGELASVINYPISNTSWAAPQSTDADYALAYSKDAAGNAIYAADQDAAAREAAVLAAALTWFEKAGYTVADGKLTAAPAGAKLEYEVWIPADGTGDHPAFMTLQEASKALEKIGFNLIVKDLANSSDLWDGLDAVGVDMWAAAWGSTVDPDMTQVYHSSNASGSNHYYIADADLDANMAAALKTSDQAYRKKLYKQCLDIILDWGVEVPVYQRKNAVIFSSERVNIDTVVKDITPFYGWLSEIEKVELK